MPQVIPVDLSGRPLGGIQPTAAPAPEPAPAPAEPPPEPAPAATAAPSEPPKPTDNQTPEEKARHASWARRERQIRDQAKALETQKADIDRQISELQKSKDQLARFDKDPVGVLLERGYTQDQIAQLQLTQPTVENRILAQVAERLDKIEKENQLARENAEKAQNEQYSSALNQIASDAKDFIEREPGFEVAKASNAAPTIAKYIESVWKEEGVLLSIDQAAKDVEGMLIERAATIAKLSKIQDKIKPQAAANPSEQVPGRRVPAPTLTNRAASGRPLTPRERAILAFEGKLGT